MRRNSSTVVVVAGPVPGEVLAAVDHSMNVALIRPHTPAAPSASPASTAPSTSTTPSAPANQPGPGNADSTQAAAEALRRAGRATTAYALVTADPLAATAAAWQAMWDVSRQEGPQPFEQEAAKTLAAWHANQFELPDYYLVLATKSANAAQSAKAPQGHQSPQGAEPTEEVPDFYLGPLRSVRPHRVALVAATDPAQQAAAVLHTLGSLRHGPWWPPLDQLIDTARTFYPGHLSAPRFTGA